MASYNARGRDPLLDSNMQAAIERRGKELAGIALILVGLAFAAMLGSYTPEDPNWMVSTDAPIQNWMGSMGAWIAGVLMLIMGMASWGIPVFAIAWGVRLALHRGEDRFFWPLVLSPFWLVIIAIYAASLTPSKEWLATHQYSLGGAGGDFFLSVFLLLLPVGLHFLVKIVSILAAIAMVSMGVFVLGFSRTEVRFGLRRFVIGIIMAYGAVMTLLGQGASATVHAARERQALRTERKEAARMAAEQAALAAQAAEAEAVIEPEPYVEPDPAPVAEPKGGLLSRMPSLIRRPEPMPEPELVEPQPVAGEQAMPGDDRIKSKIAQVVRNRKEAAGVVSPHPDPARPLTKGRGRGPDPLVLDPTAGGDFPAEPPLTSVQPFAPQIQPQPVQPQSMYVEEPAPQAVPEDYVPMDYAAEAEPVPVPQPAPVPAPQPALAASPIPVAQPRKAVVEQPARKAPQPSRRAQAEAQPTLAFEETATEFELPPLNLLENPVEIQRHHLSDEALEENARMLENVLDDYGVKGEIVSVRPGPVVTMYELEPAPGIKASRVIGLADDIARSMSALSARVSTVPGRSVIGIELPNENREKVVLREILASRDFGDSNMSLPLALGKNIGGDSVVANLAKMPHLLIAGTTGSGKSVAINTMILSLLYKLTPDECRLIMIDPKMLELSVYDGIPHLLSPVVTDPKKAVVALKWTVGEMEDRYRKMSKMGVRNIEGYNGRVREALAKGEMFSRTVQTGFDDDTGEPVFETEEFEPKVLPYIVVIVDEMADLMMVAGKEIEACIQRLAQMARASGIHLIMATQRPSVDVITGTIKANFPTRISFQVTSKIDSRTILGEMGAEQLLGMGDMLYMAGGAKITRCHGPFVSDEEVEEIVNHLKAFGPPEYMSGVVDGPDEGKADSIDAVLGLNTGGNTNGEDALYDSAVAIVIKDRKCSTSYIQRKLAIGYNKAARLVEQMEEEGLVSPANHVGKREILVPEQQ